MSKRLSQKKHIIMQAKDSEIHRASMHYYAVRKIPLKFLKIQKNGGKTAVSFKVHVLTQKQRRI